MHAEEIKAALRMAGVTASQIADDLGVTPQTVSGVIRGKTTSSKIANRISEVIGKPKDEIWEPQPLLRRTKEQLRQTA